jgi:hypothetical protein
MDSTNGFSSYDSYVGFQNPAYSESNSVLELEQIEQNYSANLKHEEKTTSKLSMNHHEESYANFSSIDELRLINERARNAFGYNLTHEIDFLCFKPLFSLKTRTYVNIVKSIQMLKPILLIFLMILILILVFRIDVFVGTSLVNTGPDDDDDLNI